MISLHFVLTNLPELAVSPGRQMVTLKNQENQHKIEECKISKKNQEGIFTF
jgi:hypothetical protein